MKETYLYHGHTIDLDLTGTIPEPIRWTYFIDEDYCSEGAMDSTLIEAVRARALELAHRSIDVLDSMRAGKVVPAATASAGSCLVGTMMDQGARRFAGGR